MSKKAEQSELLKEKIISDLNKEYESTFTIHEKGLIHYSNWLQQKYAALLLQQDVIKSISEEDYTPQVGDLFEWNGEHFWCIEAGKVSGVVNPINETFYIRGFFWNYSGITSRFIRKATKEELERLGLLTTETHLVKIYKPTLGDLVEFQDGEIWRCIEFTNEYKYVNFRHIESNAIMGFLNIEENLKNITFIRKATEDELEILGLKKD